MSARLKLITTHIAALFTMLVLMVCVNFVVFYIVLARYLGPRSADVLFSAAGLYFAVCSVSALVLTVIGSLWMLWAVDKGIKLPLQKLKRAVAEIRDGNLDYELALSGSDDFYELGEGFEQMRLRLKDSTRGQKRADEDRLQMMDNICHDLKTPITSILGYSEGIIDGVANTPEKIIEYSSVIRSKAVVLQQLTEDLRLLSRLENSQLTLELEKLELGGYIARQAAQYTSQFPNVEFITQIESDACVNADEARFGRVVDNIIQNSLKYGASETGRSRITIALGSSDGQARLRITDNGPGLKQSELSHAFDRFYRADASRSLVQGSGLGLSIAAQIVSLHKGKIWLRNSQGGGLEVNITLPLWEAGRKGSL